MKFYIYEKNLLHECKLGTEIYYDNLYIIKKNIIYCDKCNKSAPVSIILGFKTRVSLNRRYTGVGEKNMHYHPSRATEIIKSSKSFEI